MTFSKDITFIQSLRANILQRLYKRLQSFSQYIKRILGMSVEVKFLSLEATTVEIESEDASNKNLQRWDDTVEEDAHKVKLNVTFGEETSFVFTHTVHPVKSTDESIVKAQTALMNFAAALQKELHKPLQ